MIGTSWRMICEWTTSGVISALIPRMNRTLKMLLPTTLPTAMSVLPFSTAPTDTATSGELVPIATMVRPTTSGEMPSDSAIFEAPRTSASAPATSAARPEDEEQAVDQHDATLRARRSRAGRRRAVRSGFDMLILRIPLLLLADQHRHQRDDRQR